MLFSVLAALILIIVLQASMSKTSPNKIITVLPPSVTGDLPANTEVIWNRVFTMMGIFFNFAGFLDSAISEEDRHGSLKYIKEELPFVLEGWKSTPTGGKGVRFVAPKLRILEPGFPSQLFFLSPFTKILAL